MLKVWPLVQWSFLSAASQAAAVLLHISGNLQKTEHFETELHLFW